MKKLSIPEKITLGKQYLPGIGKREARQLVTAAVPGLLVTVVLWSILGAPGPKLIALVCGMGYLACCYAFFVKVEGELSMYTYLARILHFHRAQKDYYYAHGKEAIYRVDQIDRKEQP